MIHGSGSLAGAAYDRPRSFEFDIEGGHRPPLQEPKKFRNTLSRRSLQMPVDVPILRDSLLVQANRRGARGLRLHQKAGCRINIATGADGDEEIACAKPAFDIGNKQRHFAEPHDVRSKQLLAALGLRQLACVIDLLVWNDFVAMRTSGLAHPAMHRQRHGSTGMTVSCFVQAIHILGDEREFDALVLA